MYLSGLVGCNANSLHLNEKELVPKGAKRTKKRAIRVHSKNIGTAYTRFSIGVCCGSTILIGVYCFHTATRVRLFIYQAKRCNCPKIRKTNCRSDRYCLDLYLPILSYFSHDELEHFGYKSVQRDKEIIINVIANFTNRYILSCGFVCAVHTALRWTW